MSSYKEYIWSITDKQLLNQIINAKCGDVFKSDIFTMAETKWQIELCPNGWKQQHAGYCMVYVACISMPSSWNQVIITRSIDSIQTKSAQTAMVTYIKGQSKGWVDGVLSHSELKNGDYLSLCWRVRIKILWIELIDYSITYKLQNKFKKYEKIEWKINKKTLKILKKSSIGKGTESNIYHNRWIIRIYPNGWDNDSAAKCYIFLGLASMPQNVFRLKMKWTMNVLELNKSQTLTDDLSFDIQRRGEPLITFKEFKELKTCTIHMDINIISLYDIYDKQIKWEEEEKKQDLEDKETKEIRVQHDSKNNANSQWNCPLCTYLNNIKNKKCSMCDQGMRPNINNHVSLNDIAAISHKTNDGLHEEEEKKQSMDPLSDKKQAVIDWLYKDVQLPQYKEILIEEGYDKMSIIKETMTEQDLIEIGIKKRGHRKQMMFYVNKLRNKDNDNNENVGYQDGNIEGVNVYDTAK